MRFPAFSASFRNCWSDLDLTRPVLDFTLADVYFDSEACAVTSKCLFGEIPVWVVDIQGCLLRGESAWGRIALGLLGFRVGLLVEQRGAK